MKVTWGNIRRVLRKDGYSFRRARRIPPKSPPEAHQTRVKCTLTRLHRLEAAGRRDVFYADETGRRDVFYADESGFCLSPIVPYLWQKKGQTVGLPAKSHSRRLNVLGFLSKGTQGKSGRLHSFPTQDKVTASYLVESIEALLPRLERPTVIVLAHGHCLGQRFGASGQTRARKTG